jgi:hypothetical protein
VAFYFLSHQHPRFILYRRFAISVSPRIALVVFILPKSTYLVQFNHTVGLMTLNVFISHLEID